VDNVTAEWRRKYLAYSSLVQLEIDIGEPSLFGLLNGLLEGRFMCDLERLVLDL